MAQALACDTRRYGRQADLRPDFLHGDRTGRSARTASLADVRLCRNEYFIRAHTYARTGILTDPLGLAGERRAVFSIILIGNKIAG